MGWKFREFQHVFPTLQRFPLLVNSTRAPTDCFTLTNRVVKRGDDVGSTLQSESEVFWERITCSCRLTFSSTAKVGICQKSYNFSDVRRDNGGVWLYSRWKVVYSSHMCELNTRNLLKWKTVFILRAPADRKKSKAERAQVRRDYFIAPAAPKVYLCSSNWRLLLQIRGCRIRCLLCARSRV